MNFFAFPLI